MARTAATLMITALLAAGSAHADTPAVDLTISDHRFQPEAVTVPAGERVKLVVHNQDATPEEFESHELGREKIIAGHGKAIIYLGPLDAGAYPFFGEFHQATAQGRVIAR